MRSGESDSSSSATVLRRLFSGALRIFVAEALIIPSGIFIAALLTRRLEPAGYGLFMVATAIVVWIEWGVASLFSRQTIKLVSEAEDWRPVGGAALRQTFYGSLIATFVLCVSASSLAKILHAPGLASVLWLYSIEVPLFSLSRVHRNILIGLDGYGERAVVAASRLIARPVLILMFIELGLGVHGAVIGTVSASLLELLLCRLYVRPSLFGAATYPAGVIWHGALILFFTAISFRLFNRLDLLILNAFSPSTAQAGIYGAAQSISLLPNLLGLSFAPLLMATLSRQIRAQHHQAAREVATAALRGVFVLLPCVTIIAAYPRELIGLLFGDQYLAGATAMAFLAYAAIFQLVISIATSILMAVGKPGWCLALTLTLLVVSVCGHLLFIPRYGAVGAAAVTGLSALLWAGASIFVVSRRAGVGPPFGTIWRSTLAAGLVYLLAAFLSARHLPLALNVFLSVSTIPLSLFLLGEFKNDTGLNSAWRRAPLVRK